MYTMFEPVVIFVFIATLISNAGFVSAISKVSAVGTKFFTDDGRQFFIKGAVFHFEGEGGK